MSFAQMRPTTASIRSLVYNDTEYCMHSAIRDNALECCRQTQNTEINERATQILWQVNDEFQTND